MIIVGSFWYFVGQITALAKLNHCLTKLQILGVPEKAEKDEVVKVAMELKSSGIDDEYTSDVIVSRQVSYC